MPSASSKSSSSGRVIEQGYQRPAYGQSHIGYLEALLAAEMEERESRAIGRLLHEARLPRMKTLDAFEFDRSGVSAAQLRTLAEGDYVAKAEPVLLVGEADPAT
jgi:DNA replication protein DnaC